MSAFQVDDKTIIELAIYTASSLEEAQNIAQTLWDANSRSLQARYGEPSEGVCPTVTPQDMHKHSLSGIVPARLKPEAAQILKSCLCLDYQSCEFSGWDKSEARALLDTIEDAALAVFGLPADTAPKDYWKVPGVEDSEWR